MLIQSIYTHIFCRNDHFYLFNSLSGLFCEISKNTFIALYEHSYSELDKETIEFLKEKNVLIPKEEKYLYYLESKTQFNIAMSVNSELGLIIMPTTHCNLSCPYCFESKNNTASMTDEVEQQLFSFISNHKDSKSIKLTWYGGEPLLSMTRIKSIWNRLKLEFPDKPVTSHSIVTNGYLVNDEVINFFQESKLDSIQITLDGEINNHNKTRCLKSGEPTFDRIFNNILKLSTNLPSTEIIVRVNINRENLSDYTVVENLIKMEARENIYVYPGFIREDCKDGCNFCYNTISNGKDYYDFVKRAQDYGSQLECYPSDNGSKGCIMSSINSYIIGPQGEIYKCWNDIGYKDRIVSFIQNKSLGNRLRLFRYLCETSPFSDSQCKECYVFPICKGGCGHYRYRNKYENGRFNLCTPFKDQMVLESSLLDSISNSQK